jgi:hypothetical protein
LNKSIAEQNLLIAWIKSIGGLSSYIPIPVEVAIKTYEYYLRTIRGLVHDLYRGNIQQDDFVTSMADLVQAQLTRAWNEGMRENGLDPQTDMEDEWQVILDDIILNEYNYVDGFAADIVAARLEWHTEENMGSFINRAEIWANRYKDVVNRSIVVTKEQKLIWVLGATEKHCPTCAALNGIVALASVWQELDVRPQDPPNEKLCCEGWECDCSQIPTTNRQTRNARDAIMQALARKCEEKK